MFDYMTVEEVAAEWQVSTQHIQSLCRKGKIPNAIKRGIMWFIPRGTEHPDKRSNRLFIYKGTKKKIFEKGIELFSKMPYEAVTLKDIAEAVGIAQSAIYRHFESKQEILEMIYGFVREYHTANRPTLEDLQPVIKSGTPMELFNCLTYSYDETYNDMLIGSLRIVLQRMAVDEQASEIYREVVLRSGLLFGEQFYQKAIDAGRLPKVDPYSLSVLSNMYRHFMLLIWLSNVDQEQFDKIDLCQQELIEIFIRGLNCVHDEARGPTSDFG